MIKKITKEDLIFILICVAILTINFWKAHIGIGNSDEAFYISLGYRLFQGDALFGDDWHIAQMMGIFIYPFVAIYRFFNTTNEGVVLFFRILYSLFTASIGSVMYIKFRKYKIKAIVASSLFMLFSIYGLMSLSYNSMSIGFLFLAYVLYSNNKRNTFLIYLSGIVYSWSVLCTPFLAILFFVYWIIVYYSSKKEKIKEYKIPLIFSLGVVSCTILFVAFVLSRSSLSSIVVGFNHLIDSSHNQGILYLLVRNCGSIVLHFNVCLVMYILLFINITKHKNENAKIKKMSLYLVLITMFSVIYILFVDGFQRDIGGFMTMTLPLSLLGLFIIYIKGIKNMDRNLLIPFVLSLIHSLLISVSSNGGLRTLCGPLIIAASISLIFVFELEISSIYKTLFSCLCILLMLGYKITFNYGGDKNSLYTQVINEGPYKGLYYSIGDFSIAYNDVLDFSNEHKNERIAFVSDSCWQYLAIETNNVLTNSTYLAVDDKSEYIKVLNDYYSEHRKELPVYLYIYSGNSIGLSCDETNIINSEFYENRISGCVLKISK